MILGFVKMAEQNFYLLQSLNNFGKEVVRRARISLSKRDKNASGDLYESLNYSIEIKGGQFEMSFLMEDYGDFVDQGVSGTKVKYNTPFSYSNKFPPKEPLLKWAKIRGIRGRDKKTGRYISDSSFGFLLQRHIFEDGVKPSLFFTNAFNNAFDTLPDDLIEGLALDVDNFLEQKINF